MRKSGSAPDAAFQNVSLGLRISLAALAATGILSTGIAADASARSMTYSFDIPAQNLNDALQALAFASQHKLLYSSKLIEGKNSPALKGAYTTEEAVKKLLFGTDLVYQVTEDGLVVIRGPIDQTVSTTSLLNANGEQTWPRLAQLNVAFTEDAAAAGGASNSPAQPQFDRLEEIVVTARRREEKAQSVPVAITALSQENLRENNINSIQDLQDFVPSLTMNGLERNGAGLFLRGQGPAGGVAGVLTYLNEVPLPVDNFQQSIAGPGVYYDLENVQVLKGPQGTLFGGTTVGGAILFQPKRPTNEFGGHLEFTGGNYDNRQLDAALNVPLVADKLLVRLAVNGQQRDGYTHVLGVPNHPNGKDFDNIDYWATRATVTFRPIDALQNDLILDHVDYQAHGAGEILTYLNPNGAFAQVPGVTDLFAQQQALGIRKSLPLSEDPVNSGVFTLLTDILRYDITENIAIRNIFGYYEFERQAGEDRDGTSFNFFDIHAGSNHTTQYTEELQLQGNSFGGKLAWVTGAFFLRHPYDEFDTLDADLVGLSHLIFSVDRQKSDSKAGYSQATYDLSSWVQGLKFTAGLRYTWDKRDKQVLSGACIPIRLADPSCTTTSPTNSEALTWNLGFDYQATPGTLLYVASRRGYRPGGANGGGLQALSGAPYDPEYVDDVELGVKSDWAIAGMPVRTNVDVYYQDYKDIQAQQQVPVSGGNQQIFVFITANAAGARLQGAEFEGSINPTPRLRLGAIYSWLDYKYTKFDPGVDGAGLIAGQHIARPRNKYGLNARYQLPVSPDAGEVSLSANWSWQSWSGQTIADLGPGADTPAYGLLTLGANWDHIGGGLIDASFFMTNALNKTYINAPLGFYNSLGYSTIEYGEPRMWGLRLRYRFGAN